MACLWLLALSHYIPEERAFYHEFAITAFEIAMAMEYVINPLYWTLIYDHSKFDPWVWSTYRGPYINHLLPFILLNIEWMLNGFHFNYPHSWRHVTAITSVYVILNYCGSMYLGKPLYTFVNWQNPMTFLIILCIMIYQYFIFTTISYINNFYLKNGHKSTIVSMEKCEEIYDE